VAFVAVCEGFLGIDPHFDLWWYLFAINLVKRWVGKQDLHALVGCASIHLRNTRAGAYPLMHLTTSNKGWHSQWFYVKNDATAPLPAFIGRYILEASESWGWGVQAKDKKHLNDLLAALRTLKERGVKGLGIIGAYHTRRVMPLMEHVLPLYQMVPEASFEGTTLADEALPPSEVAQRIKEAMEPTKDSISTILDFVYPVLRHPPMRPEPRFVDFVSFLFPCSSFHLKSPIP
jgi:hypothetical protein